MSNQNMEHLSEEVRRAEELKEKWAPLLEASDDYGFSAIKGLDRYRATAVLLENTEKDYKQQIRESNNTQGIDIVDPVLINLVRRTAPNMIAYDMCGVQPMTGPTGTVFAMRAYYGSQPAGPFGRPGDARSGFQTGSAVDSNSDTLAQQYGISGKAPNEAFYNEADTTYSGTGTQSANDGTVAYSAYDAGVGMSTSTAETLGGSESGDASWGEMSFTIEKTTVEAKTRALKAEYTVELAQDLKSVHGLDAETELSQILSNEILAEQNREVTNTIRKIAKIGGAEVSYENGQIERDSAGDAVYGTAGLFDLDTNSDGRWQAEKFKSLLMKINKEANIIAKETRRGRGNFIIVSSDVAAALDLAGKLDYAPGVDNALFADDTGVTYIGTMQGRFKVYIDPYVLYDEVIVGYKGTNQYDAGFFYCPYVPLQMFRAVDPNTFQPKIGYKTRYGMVSNPFTTMDRNLNLYYRKFKVSLV